MSGRAAGLRLLIPVAVGATACGALSPASADPTDDLRAAISAASRAEGLGDAVQSIAAFGALPGISAASFTVDGSPGSDDTDLTRLTLPLAHTYEATRTGPAALRTELTLGFLQADQDYPGLLAGTPLAVDVESRLRSFSAIGGFGVDLDLGGGFALRPMGLIGYSRVEDDSDFAGPGEAQVEAVTSDILFDYELDDLLYGVAVELAYDVGPRDGVRLEGELRYNHLFVENLQASDASLERSSDFDVVTARAELSGPLASIDSGRQLRWIALAAASVFPGDSADGLGIDQFVELGGGVELDAPGVVPGIGGAKLLGSVIVGDGVSGWSIAVRLAF